MAMTFANRTPLPRKETSQPRPIGGAAKRRRRRLFVLLTVALGCVVSLLLLEVAFRCFWTLPPWFAEFQQAGMYTTASDGSPVLQPGYRGTLQIVDRQTNVAINSLGMRDPEPVATNAAEKRVLVIGDSMVFGYSVEHDEALPQALQRALARQGVAAHVGNGGVPGFGSRSYVQHMQRLDESFHADAFVICGCLGNDSIDDTKPYSTVYAGLKVDGVIARGVRSSWRMRLAFRSRAALWLESWIVINKPSWSPLASVPIDPIEAQLTLGMPPMQKLLGGVFLDVRDEATTWQEGTAPVIPRLCGYLRESLVSARKIAGDRVIVFVILPTSRQTHVDRYALALEAAGFEAGDYQRGLGQQRWLDAARQAGVEGLDATAVLQDAGTVQELFIEDASHLSARGCQVVGDWLAASIVERLR